jgi:hypothetical protein
VTVSEHADQIVVLDHVVEASDHASLTGCLTVTQNPNSQ